MMMPVLLLCCEQVLEAQLQTRRQRELDLEQQVAELQTRVSQLSGAFSSAEAANRQTDHLERQVRHTGLGTKLCRISPAGNVTQLLSAEQGVQVQLCWWWLAWQLWRGAVRPIPR